MILADTSVWIGHLRSREPDLAVSLQANRVLCHPFVIGELACGNVKNRRELLGLLMGLPRASVATNDEALAFIDRHSLAGTGLGFVDVHLLASAALSDAKLWTLDRRLATAADKLGLRSTGQP